MKTVSPNTCLGRGVAVYKRGLRRGLCVRGFIERSLALLQNAIHHTDIYFPAASSKVKVLKHHRTLRSTGRGARPLARFLALALDSQ